MSNRSNTPTLPHSEESERVLLAAILRDPDNNYPKISAIIKHSDFYIENHRLIYSAMAELYSCGSPVDLVTLVDYLRSSDQLERINGTQFLVRLTDGIPGVLNTEHYARTVKEKSKQRRLLHALNNTQTAYLSGSGTEQDALAALKTALSEVEELNTQIGPSTWRTVSCDNPEDWQHIAPVEWCCDQIIPRNSLGFVGGGPKDGKSVIMLDLMILMAQAQFQPDIKWLGKYPVHGMKVFYVSKEDGMERLNERWPDINQSYGFTNPPPGLTIVPRKMSALMLTEPDHMKWLEEQLIRTESNFLCLDVFSELIPGIDEMKEIRQALTVLKDLRDRLNITITVIDHTRKAPAGNPKFKQSGQDMDPMEIRGAFKFGAADWVIMIGSTNESNKVKLSIKCKDAIESVQSFVIIRSPMGSDKPKHQIEATLDELASHSRQLAVDNRDAVLNILENSDTELGAQEVSELVGMSLRTAQRHLATLVRTGTIHARTVNGHARYSALDNGHDPEQEQMF